MISARATAIEAADALVADLYRAAAGELHWGEPLAALRTRFSAWGVHLPASFRIAVVEVPPCTAALSVEIDGTPVFSASYAGTQTAFEVVVPVPGGTHAVRVRNAGNDWIKVARYTVQGVQIPVVAALGQASAARVYLWVYDMGSSQYHLLANGSIRGARVAVTGLNDGDYRIEFWRTRAPDGPLGTALARVSSGALAVPLPDLARNVAAKLARSTDRAYDMSARRSRERAPRTAPR